MAEQFVPTIHLPNMTLFSGMHSLKKRVHYAQASSVKAGLSRPSH
jgi:hypothetical protein